LKEEIICYKTFAFKSQIQIGRNRVVRLEFTQMKNYLFWRAWLGT